MKSNVIVRISQANRFENLRQTSAFPESQLRLI